MADQKQGTAEVDADASPIGRNADGLTRKQVADLLGVSIFKVRTLERKGELHPVVRNGTNFFTLVEINSLVQMSGQGRLRGGRPVDPRTDGEIAAEVFKLFEEGMTLVEIVTTAAVVPEKVRALFAEYAVTLEDGERRRHARERKLEEEKEAAREEIRDEKHAKLMLAMDKNIQAQTSRLERLAGANDNSRRRRADRTPVTAAPPPEPGGSTASADAANLEAVFNALVEKLR